MTHPCVDGPEVGARRMDRPSRIMLVLAALWALGLLAAGLTIPSYSGESIGTTTSTNVRATVTTTVSLHATLVQINGTRVLIPLAVPLIAVIFVATALSIRRRAGKTGPGPAATTILVLIGAGTLAAMLTIGVSVLPVDALLLATCVRTSNPSTAAARRR